MSGFDGKAVVYGASISNKGGTGVYVRRLLEGFVDLGTTGVSVALGEKLMRPSEALRATPEHGTLRKLLHEHLKAPRLASSANPDIVHLPAFGGMSPPGFRYVVTLHDLAFMDRPSSFPLVRSLYYRALFGRLARGATLVMVDSDFTGSEAERLLGVASDVVRRVYLSTDDYARPPALFRERFGVEGDYLIYVGTVEPRKNVGSLLEAWRKASASLSVRHLVVAGRWGWGRTKLRSLLETEPGVVWTGELEEPMLRSAVTGARLLVYPSLYEGFGLPPLEAASAGVPSVIGPAEALREVYGEIAIRARAGDADSISVAVSRALDSKVDPEKLREFASRYNPAGMSARVLEVYGEAAS
ncbi:glycosyltransferase [Candidatus Fermentibacteria bacterium]|nr:glycosyltransferase [Candidatus Fermentibacteria bacterium]